MTDKTDKRWREMMRSSAGKGTALRPMDKKKYNDNWERIFGNAQDQEENVKDLPQNTESFGQEKI
jgi:hypothetical protein